MQLYSSAKPWHNVPSSVFWFDLNLKFKLDLNYSDLNFCFLPFLHRISVQKWKKIWFCYAHERIGKKEMSAKISKCLCQNLHMWAATQIIAVCRHHKILVTLKRGITLSFKFLDMQQKISIVLWLSYLRKHFSFSWRQCN